MNNRKIIIPWLITLKTKIKNIRWFEICDDLGFFNEGYSSRYTYKLNTSNKIGNYSTHFQLWNIVFTKNNLVIYKLKKGGINLFFCYDIKNMTFTCSKNYAYIPFQIWNIYPAGKIISDIMRYNLNLNWFLTCLWAAVRYKNKNYILLWPSKSWKTTLMNMLIDKWWEYIAEDMLIVDKNNGLIYPTSITNNQGRSSNKELKNNIYWKTKTTNYYKIDSVIFLWDKKDLKNYIYIYSLNFLENTFIKAILYEHGDSTIFNGMHGKIEKFILTYETIYEKNLEKIINKLWQ